MDRTLTILLSDLVDSTELHDRLGDARMASVWQAHDRAARELMRAWHGKEIARSDGFLVLFDQVRDAVSFARHYHQSLQRIHPGLKARVGIHIGQGALRENTQADRAEGAPAFEIDGVVLPTAARVMGAASGGQTLLSSAAIRVLGEAAGTAAKSHGHWRFKGISEPLEIFEIGVPGSSFQPPADSAKAYRVVQVNGTWVPGRTIPNNLPAERDTFVGRSNALQTLAQLLEGSARLVTVLGIGGIGKTRLVVRFAHTWLGDYPGGAWFSDLSTARSIEGIAYAVAKAIDVPLNKSDPVQQVASSIAALGPCLIVLDTFEQIARHAESTLGVWLESAPEAKFIATSREVLGIPGEHTHVIAPMEDDESAELFLERVAAAAPRSSLATRDELAVGALVRLLDGLPLAIELAAARSRLMSPKMLLERMHERFTLLAARGGRLDRQVTLRATLDWSWDLLLPAERAALAQLSVFEGGFSLDAAEAVVVVPDEQPPVWPLDAIQSLIDKSFVRKVGEDRFDLLQSVHEYAAGHLRSASAFPGSGPAAALAAEIRHSRHFSALDSSQITAPGSLDLDNLVVACRRAVLRGDSVAAARTLSLSWAALELRGPFRLGLELASLVSTMPALSDSFAIGVLLIRGRALRALGRSTEAAESFTTALADARAGGDQRSEAEALSKLGWLKTTAGKLEEARVNFRAGLALARQIKDESLECELLNGLGTLHDAMGDVDSAVADYELALTVSRRIGNRRWEGGILGNLGNAYYNEGRLSEANAAYDAGLVIAMELGNRQWEANSLCNLGLLQHAIGQCDVARKSLQRSLEIARQIGHARLEAFALCNLGTVECSSGDTVSARRHFENALVVSESLGDFLLHGQILGHLGLLCTRLGATDEGRLHLLRGQEILEATDDLPSLAILHCNSAQSFAFSNELEAAEQRLATAMDISQRLGEKVVFDVRKAIDETRAALSQRKSADPQTASNTVQT